MKCKIRFTGEIPDGFKPRGALEECFGSYCNFEEDFELLVNLGYAAVDSAERCKWLRSKTSLAEYLYWANSKDGGGEKSYVPGGFWAPAEGAFGFKRHSLRKLAGKNGNFCKPDDSKDFLELKPHLEGLRKRQERIRIEARIFRYLKHLILVEAGDERPEAIHGVLEKIIMLFNEKNVDKKATKPLLNKRLDNS